MCWEALRSMGGTGSVASGDGGALGQPRVRGTEASGGHGGEFGDTGDARRSGWTCIPCISVSLAHPEISESPGRTPQSASPVTSAHPAAPVPSFCNMRRIFGVLTYSCAPDTRHSNVSCCGPRADVTVHPSMCCGAHLTAQPNTQPCSPTPGNAHQHPAVHPDTWLSPSVHGPPICVRHALHPNPCPGEHLAVHILPCTLSHNWAQPNMWLCTSMCVLGHI